MPSPAFTGGCQCGAIHYKSVSKPEFGAHCHCQHCRKSTGSEHLSALFVPNASFSFTGNTSIYETTGDGGAQLQRHFCPTCGSSLFIEHKPKGGYFVMAGTLDDIELFSADFELYCKHKASWDAVSSRVAAFDEMPPAK